jgi:hypothetical protein
MLSPVCTGLYLSHFAPEKILAGIKQQVRLMCLHLCCSGTYDATYLLLCTGDPYYVLYKVLLIS